MGGVPSSEVKGRPELTEAQKKIVGEVAPKPAEEEKKEQSSVQSHCKSDPVPHGAGSFFLRFAKELIRVYS